MFYGSVPAEAQAIMNKIVKAWDVTDIYVGCSGNFTLEKFIGPLGKFRLHSNVWAHTSCGSTSPWSCPRRELLSSRGSRTT